MCRTHDLRRSLVCLLVVCACGSPGDADDRDAAARGDGGLADAAGGPNDAATGSDASVSEEDAASPADAGVDASTPPGTPVAMHGALHVSGNRIVDALDVPIALRGMSLFWSQWASEYWTAGVVTTLADDWQATVVRAAMGVESGGYLTNPTAERAKVVTIVDAAIAEGIYVIIDWHDHEAQAHLTEARAFFVDMATRYANVPNVLFEIYNEPDGESWSTVKTYAEDVIDAIRGTGAQNIVIVGTPTWSQDVDIATASPITNRTNIAYTLHFYAGSHGQSLRDKASLALSRGFALFVTEWGACEASGNGNIDLVAVQAWLDFLDANMIGAANWSLFDKDESCSALVPAAVPSGPWSAGQLTTSGAFVRGAIRDAE